MYREKLTRQKRGNGSYNVFCRAFVSYSLSLSLWIFGFNSWQMYDFLFRDDLLLALCSAPSAAVSLHTIYIQLIIMLMMQKSRKVCSVVNCKKKNNNTGYLHCSGLIILHNIVIVVVAST